MSLKEKCQKARHRKDAYCHQSTLRCILSWTMEVFSAETYRGSFCTAYEGVWYRHSDPSARESAMRWCPHAHHICHNPPARQP